MEQNQEVLTLATVSTVLEVGRRVLMNMGDDFPSRTVSVMTGNARPLNG
jgi:hypothetical protein